jgi:hypothetical protein
MKTLLKIGLAAVALSACVVALSARAGGKAPTLYAVTNLGPGQCFAASNLDASGTFLVVGSILDSTAGVQRATVWTVNADGTVADVFTYNTLGNSEAVDVNDHGIVIGTSSLGTFIDVPGVGIRFPNAGAVLGVNNLGFVVGLTGDPSGPVGISGAVWAVDVTGEITGPVTMTIGPGVAFIPEDINDEGTMAGYVFSENSDGSSSSFAAIAEFDHNGALHVTDLGTLHPGDTTSKALSINSDGLVAGYSSGKTQSAFLFDPSQPNKLTSLGTQVIAGHVNDNAQVVFASNNKANVIVGVIWQNGKTTDLNTVLTAPLSDSIEAAVGINNTGHIVGFTQSGNACILTPQ